MFSCMQLSSGSNNSLALDEVWSAAAAALPDVALSPNPTWR